MGGCNVKDNGFVEQRKQHFGMLTNNARNHIVDPDM